MTGNPCEGVAHALSMRFETWLLKGDDLEAVAPCRQTDYVGQYLPAPRVAPPVRCSSGRGCELWPSVQTRPTTGEPAHGPNQRGEVNDSE